MPVQLGLTILEKEQTMVDQKIIKIHNFEGVVSGVALDVQPELLQHR
jgi:hypothetical protein